MQNADAAVHNPSQFNPADYEVVDYLDNRRPVFFGQTVEEFENDVRFWESEMARALGDDWRRKIGHCVHCGNGHVRWITAVEYKPTGERVVFGADCTRRLEFTDRHQFKLAQLQARDEARKVRVKAYLARQAFVESHSSIEAALAAITEPVHAGNRFVQDVLAKLDQYGSLSDKQVEAVEQSLARDFERAAAKAAEAVEVKGDAPDGRAEVSGIVLSVKYYESDFGGRDKMLVKLDNNARVFVAVPGGASGIERNDRVTVRATWARKADDPSFAFGKRPFLVNHAPAAKPAQPARFTVGPSTSTPDDNRFAAIFDATLPAGQPLIDGLDAAFAEAQVIRMNDDPTLKGGTR